MTPAKDPGAPVGKAAPRNTAAGAGTQGTAGDRVRRPSPEGKPAPERRSSAEGKPVPERRSAAPDRESRGNRAPQASYKFRQTDPEKAKKSIRTPAERADIKLRRGGPAPERTVRDPSLPAPEEKSLAAREPAPAKPAPAGKKKKNDFIKPTDVIRIKGHFDYILLVLVIVITLFGIIMDFSASYAYAYVTFGDSYHFVKLQLTYACLGLVVMFIVMNIDYEVFRRFTVPVFLVAIALLFAVLVYGVASGVAQRWLYIGGFSVQPSEIMKTALVLILALYISQNQNRVTNYKNFWQSSVYGVFIPIAIIGVVCGLVALERHFSGTIILFAIGIMVIFAGGARKVWLFGAGAAGAAILIPAIFLVPYARERVDMLIHPESYDITGKIWQTMQGLYAVGSGGVFGVGLGNSRQKHLFVSQPQNDFIFSIIAEELGFAGAAFVIILFILLVWRGFSIALKAPDTFSSLTVIGLTCKVAIQSILNIAVVINLVPNTGISLPFFSYGGSALIMQLAEMGIILSVSRYSYQKTPEIR